VWPKQAPRVGRIERLSHIAAVDESAAPCATEEVVEVQRKLICLFPRTPEELTRCFDLKNQHPTWQCRLCYSKAGDALDKASRAGAIEVPRRNRK
jgi:hypothetical protein